MALASPTLTTGTAVFGLALPQGVATTGVKVGSLDTQTDIKRTWGDGSIKFCVVSAQVPSTAAYDITSGPATSGTFTPTWPSASVAFDIGGTVYTATLPSLTTSDPWLVGPNVKEYRVIQSPVNGATPHALLQVIWDIRSYAAGGHRVDVTVQNIKDISDANSVTYDVDITVGGSGVFSQDAVTHYILTRWRKTFTTGSPSLSTVTPDFEPFHLAKTLPRYLATIDNPTYTFETTGEQDYGILKHGKMVPFMMTPGARAEIGPYPFWVAHYVVHKGASQLEAVLRNAEAMNSWPLCVAESDGTSIIRLDSYPNYWIDARSGIGHANESPEIPRLPGPEFRGMAPDPIEPDNQHLPGCAWPAYWITGDRFFYDTAKFVANWGMLFTYPGDSTQWGCSYNRETGKGILTTNGGRGFAWPLREVANAAAYTNDTDADKTYFEARLSDNLDWCERYITDVLGATNSQYSDNPLGMVNWQRNTGFEDQVAGISLGFFSVGLWQLAYLAWAIQLAHDHGYSSYGGAGFIDACCALQIKYMTSGPDYPPEYSCPFFSRMGQYPLPYPPADNLADFTHFTSMAQVFSKNHGDDSGYAVDDTTPGHRLPQPILGYYGVEGRLLARIGLARGLTNAQAAVDYIEGYSGLINEVNGRSGFAILPFSQEAAPTTKRRARWRFRA